MIQQSLKIFVLGIIILSPLSLFSAQPDSYYPQRTGSRGYGPNGCVENYSRPLPAREPKPLSRNKQLKANIAFIVDKNCCRHCIFNYCSGQEDRKKSYKQCADSKVCKLTTKLDTICDNASGMLGLNYWYVKFTLWDLSKWIIDNCDTHYRMSQNNHEILTAIAKGIEENNLNDKNLNRLLALAVAHNNWCQSRRVSTIDPFSYSFDK